MAPDNSEPIHKARIARRLNQQTNRLFGAVQLIKPPASRGVSDLNGILYAAEDEAKLIGKKPGTTKASLRRTVNDIWKKAKLVEGQGEFGKVLKRLYRLAGLAGARFLRPRALRDVLVDPALSERVADLYALHEWGLGLRKFR